MSRRLIAGIALLCTCSLSAVSQDSAGQTPTFHSQSELVQIPIIVTRHGKYVSGLKPQDFTVFEDGVPQKIARFEEIEPHTTDIMWQKQLPGVYTNKPWANQPAGQVMIIAIDFINTPYIKQSFVRDSLLKFLSAVPDRRDPIMLVGFTEKGLQVVHGFTDDTAALRSAVLKLKSRLSGNEHPEALAQDKREAQEAAMSAVAARNGGHVDPEDPEVKRLEALFQTTSDAYIQSRSIDKNWLTLLLMQRLAASLSGIPGRKSLVWATGGITFIPGSRPPGSAAETAGKHQVEGVGEHKLAQANDIFDKTWDALSDANIAVYPVDIEEVFNPAFSSSQSAGPTVETLMGRGFGLRAQAMNAFVDKTGGAYCQLQSNLERCFTQAMDDSAHYYMLAYYPKSAGAIGWRKLKIKVAGDALRVHARSGYYFRARNAEPQTRQVEVAEAIVSPIDADGIPIAVRWIDGPSNAANTKRSFEVFVDARSVFIDNEHQNHFRLSLVVASHTEQDKYFGRLSRYIDGHLQQQDLGRLAEKRLVYRDTIDTEPADKDIRFLVRDELSGRIGSVTVKLDQ